LYAGVVVMVIAAVFAIAVRDIVKQSIASFAEPVWSRRSASSGIDSINVRDGIDEHEAQRIADVYWISHQPNLCGGPSDPTRHGEWWDTTISVGYSGRMTRDSLRVHSVSGAIVSTFARPYRDLEEFEEHLTAYESGAP
jgi:hypothetical protein